MIQGLKKLVRWRSVEDWLHDYLRDGLAGSDPPIQVVTRMRDGQPMPFITVKEVPLLGVPPEEPDWLRFADVEINCFTDGIEAEVDGFNLASACETLLRKLPDHLVDGRERVRGVQIREPAARRSDWADATSSVQYQDLAIGVERFRVQARLILARRQTANNEGD